MRFRLLPFFAAAALIYVASSPATACEYEKARSAKASTASTAKSCGATQAKSATAVADHKAACSAHETSAVTAANASSCEVGKAIQTAVLASNGAASKSAVAAGSDAECTYMSAAECAIKCSSSKNAVAAAERAGCSASKTQATVAVANARQKLDAVVAGSQCGTSTKSALKAGAHGDCEACTDWSACEGELSNVQSTTQVVPLKNGVMYVFTASSPKDVRIVQAVLSGRSNHLQTLIEAGDKATLCAQCKAFRGAIASGNLNREVVNVEGGSLMIMTSPDREMVNQLHLLAGIQSPDHIKG